MFRVEQKAVSFIQKHLDVIFVAVISVLALVLRITEMHWISRDAQDYLLPWFQYIDSHGNRHALGDAIGNYNVPYYAVMAFLSYFPGEPICLIKLPNIICDYLLAGAAGYCVWLLSQGNRKLKGILTYCVILLSVNVILNSTVWGQCDVIYTLFVLLCVLALFRDKVFPAFLFMGAAFAFKLQALFFLPVLVLYWFKNKKCSLFHFLIIPGVNLVLCIPAMIEGRKLSDIFTIYFRQTSEYNWMTLNYPNLYALLQVDYHRWYVFAVLLAFSAVGIGAYVLARSGVDYSGSLIIESAIWFIWAILLFMPGMHDRYGYMIDIFAIVLAMINRKWIWLAILYNLVSFLSYTEFLFNYSLVELPILAIVNMLMFAVYTVMWFKRICCENGTEVLQS